MVNLDVLAITALSTSLILLVAFGWMFRRLASRVDARPSTPEWLHGFSLASYKPLERLFSEDDFEFLASQSGYRPEMTRRLRKERKQIFRGYLKELVTDFNRLYNMATIAMIYSPEDRPGVASTLWKHRITFYFAVCAIECRLLFGIRLASVADLVNAVEQMRQQARLFLPSPAPAN